MKLTLNVRNWFLYLETGPELDSETEDEETGVATVSEVTADHERADHPTPHQALGFRRMQ